MVMQVDHSSGGSGVLNFPDLEPPEPEFAPPAPPPAVPPPAPPTPAANSWVEQLPAAAFGPPTPHPGETPAATVLAELAPPPAVAVIETSAAAPVVALAAAAAPTAPTAPAMEIATLELTLADPLTRELIHHHGGTLPVLDLGNLNPALQEQVDRYGADLTARLMQLAQANAAVRTLYLEAMDQAAQGLGADTMGAVFVPGVRGNRGDSVPDSWRFDPVAFTQAYAQAGLQHDAPLAQRAFAATFGSNPLQAWERHQGGDSDGVTRGHTLAGSFELSAPTLTDLDGHPSRERLGWTGASLNPDSHGLRPLSLQAPPELHNPQAVWFDAGLGWVTPSENIAVKQDFLDKAIPVVFIGVMTWATAGAFGVAGGAGVTAGTGIGAGAGVVGAMTAGAAFGAIGGFYGGLIGEGKIDLGGMFRGALTGAITAGVVRATGLDSMGIKTGTNAQGQQIVTGIEVAQRALAVTGQATLQGALQQISGGEFVDGFTAGLANGLGVEIARGLQLQIDTLSNTGSIDATQAGALRQFARVAQSAVSLLGNPDDPGHAFAMTFVNGLVSDAQQGLAARETQGTGLWSDAGYLNGSDIDSDNADQARRDQEWAAQNDALLSRRGDEQSQPRADTDGWLLPSPSPGLRLSPAAAAEFQAALQEGIDRAAADPGFDPSIYAPARLAQLLADDAGYSGVAGLLDDESETLAGPGGARTKPSATGGTGLQFNLNQRANTVFEALGNAPVGDAFGLVPEAYRDIKLLAPLIQESRLLGEVERMRTVLGQSGFDVTPQKLGAVPGIDSAGRIAYDPVDLADRYANAIRLLELQRQGVIELDVPTFTVRSVGTERIPPDTLVRNVEQRYQAAFSQGLNTAEQRLAAGERLRFPVDMPQQLQVGLYADSLAKQAVERYLDAIGVTEGPGQIVALNRWAYDPSGSGLYVRPDVLVDFGPSQRHWIDGKSSFVNNGLLPQQLRSFFEYTGSQSGTIATRDGTIPLRGSRRRP